MKCSIYMKVGDRDPVFLEKCRNEETALLHIRYYEKKDREEITTEGYKMPVEGLPKYFMVF